MAKTRTRSIPDKTYRGFGNLIKLLPTGTVFLFQFLNPVLTNNGHCHPVNKILTAILISVSAVSCIVSSFTDSYRDHEGTVHYAIATRTGLWPNPATAAVDPSVYRLRLGDFLHSFLSVLVFAVLSLLDTNTVGCFYPSFAATEKVLLMTLPPVIGAISGTVFMVFPNKRHGIGYPSTNNEDDHNELMAPNN